MASEPVAEIRHGRTHRSFGLAMSAAAAVVAADQLTKWLAVRALGDGSVIDLVWTLRLNLVRNDGSAFSLGSGLTPIIAVLAIVISIVLVQVARRVQGAGPAIVVGLVLGGAVGNLVDRVVRSDGGLLDGAVVDFIDLQWWPVFNVADIAIVVGCCLLLATVGRADRDGGGLLGAAATPSSP